MSKGMLGKLPLSAVRGPVDTLYNNLASDDGPLVLAELKKFNRRRTCWPPASATASPEPPAPLPLLVFDDEHIVSVALSERHDPKTFWKDTAETPARYVWGGFATIAAQAKPREPSGVVKLPYADLPRATTVRDILAAPGVGNFDPTDLCAIIAAMIGKQPNGEAGDLLNDGRANLFPCGSVLVRVHWYDVCRHWRVHGWDPGLGVGAPRRVFSGNLKL